MVSSIEEDAVEAVFKLEPLKPERFRGVFSSASQELLHPEVSKFEAPEQQLEKENGNDIPKKKSSLPAQVSSPKVGRNEPCPCGAKDPITGSPIKYKKCHGK